MKLLKSLFETLKCLHSTRVYVCVNRKENHKSALTSASFIYQLPDKARTFKAYYNKY